MIKRLIIRNFKGIRFLDMEFNQIRNVLVGNNGVGKSTIIEAIQLALGENEYNMDITQYYFHKSVWADTDCHPSNLPKIEIELYFSDDLDDPIFTGKNNLTGDEHSGIRFTFEFDIAYEDLYLNHKKHGYIPCEYYTVKRTWFSGENVKRKLNPFKTFVVDSSNTSFNARPRQFLAHLLEDDTDNFRPQMLSCLAGMRLKFDNDNDVINLNKTLSERTNEVRRNLCVSVDLTSKNAYTAILSPFVEEIPFELAGMGEQCIIKTLLSLGFKDGDKKPRLIIIEEPETHLSHTMMYELINLISSKTNNQIIITTHSSYVANRLELDNVIVLNKNADGQIAAKQLNTLSPAKDYKFFFKATDYATLRIILCKAAILVEGPTDEMVCQYCLRLQNKNIFHDGVELMAVGGVAFGHFIELAKDLGIKMAIIRDKDKENQVYYDNLYLHGHQLENIKIFIDPDFSTIEPSFVNANRDRWPELSATVRRQPVKDETMENLTQFMLDNKTEWAYRLLNSTTKLEVPLYISKAIEWIYEK